MLEVTLGIGPGRGNNRIFHNLNKPAASNKVETALEASSDNIERSTNEELVSYTWWGGITSSSLNLSEDLRWGQCVVQGIAIAPGPVVWGRTSYDMHQDKLRG